MRTGFRKGSCSSNKLERDDDSSNRHPALVPVAPLKLIDANRQFGHLSPQPIAIIVYGLDFAGGDSDPGDVVDGGANHPGILSEDIERPGVNIALPAQFRHVRLEAGNIGLDAAQNFEHHVLGHRVCLPVFDDMAALASLARPRDLPVADSTSRPRPCSSAGELLD